MKNAAACARKLATLVKKLPAAEPALPRPDASPLDVLVHSFLLWETSADKAQNAFQKVADATVDFNDLRVTLPHEILGIIGQRYPRGLDRARRLRATLKDVYLREHDVCLDRLADLGKREVRKYLETLDGIVPYVASRVMLLCYDVHAMPVDEQLRAKLIEVGAADESADVAELAAWLSRQVKSARGVPVHAALQVWAAKRTGAARRSTRKSAGGRTSRKKSGKSGKSAKPRRAAARASK